MKAYVLYGVNNLVYEDVKKPEIKEDEVVVEVKASGICGSDIPRIYQTGAHRHPLIPGHEFSGIVCESKDKSLIGKKVGVFPLIPCKKCEQCKNKHYEMCSSYSYLGSRQDGGFAQYVLVPKENLIFLPENVDFKVAAMLEPMAVAVHCIRKMKIGNGESVMVTGLGAIGMFIVMFLANMGVKNIYAVGNKDIQKEKISQLGRENIKFLDIRDKDELKKYENSVDVYFECVGKNETIEMSLLFVKPLGRIMLLGNPHSDIKLKKDIYWKILRKQLTLKGTWNSSFTYDENDDWHYVLDLVSKKIVDPSIFITDCVKFENLKDALEIMRDKSREYIKFIVQY